MLNPAFAATIDLSAIWTPVAGLSRSGFPGRDSRDVYDQWGGGGPRPHAIPAPVSKGNMGEFDFLAIYQALTKSWPTEKRDLSPADTLPGA